jgi:beta-N-acetylhexosaminidase
MTAHVLFPAVDDKPPTFSKIWLQDILREKLHYKGLVISDDLNMAGAACFGDPVARAKMALNAGCDLLLCCNNKAALYDTLDNHTQLTQLTASFERIMQCSIR